LLLGIAGLIVPGLDRPLHDLWPQILIGTVGFGLAAIATKPQK
jgi:hypothetical protein